MKYAAASIALALASPVLAQDYVCQEWSAPGYQEAGPLSAIISDDRLTWSNGQTISEAELIHRGRTDDRRVFAAGDTIYIARGRSTVDLRRVHIFGAEQDSTTSCVASGQ